MRSFPIMHAHAIKYHLMIRTLLKIYSMKTAENTSESVPFEKTLFLLNVKARKAESNEGCSSPEYKTQKDLWENHPFLMPVRSAPDAFVSSFLYFRSKILTAKNFRRLNAKPLMYEN